MKKKIKQRLKKVMIGSMLIAISLPLFSGFMPQEDQGGLVADPKIMQALLESQQDQPADEEMPVLPNIEGDYKVMDVADGTSLTVMWGDEEATVKLIGVDVPQDMQKDAAAFLKAELEGTDMVSLEFDVKDKDEEGNLLAYVYLPDDVYTSLNSKLLVNGCARLAEESENERYIEDLRGAQQQARESKVGLWADEKEKEHDR